MSTHHSIQKVIEQSLIEPHYQGIINFYNEDYMAFESLIRTCPDIDNIAPDQLFSMAETQGYLLELDHFCIIKAITHFQAKQLPGLLFINILPVSISKILSLDWVNRQSGSLQGIVFEISEKHPLDSYSELKDNIKMLRQQGALIAIDDLGSGHSGLISWAEIKPDFVKIDRHFIYNIHNDGIKREFVRSIVEIARGLRCKVIAEGIETSDELEVLHSIGIKLGQGYLFHRPEATPSASFNNTSCFTYTSESPRLNHIRHAETADSLMEAITPIGSSTHAEIVSDLFKKTPSIRSLPIVDNGKVVGMISRTKILEIFSGRYSYPLHGKKAIKYLMNTTPIIVDHAESIQNISTMITHNNATDLNADFIITKNNHYAGVGRVSTLLKLLTDNQIMLAKHCNPLSLLPGNVPISEHIEDLISQEQPFHLAYFDINHFKPFNDYFGYSYGDEVIKQLAEVISREVSSHLDMAGHIGGDDFVVIFRSNDWQKKCKNILEAFKIFTLKFYSKEEISQQGIWCKDRRGEQDFFHLLSLSIGVVNPDISGALNHHDVSELASNAKKQAKLQGGNYLFVSRRRSNTYNNLSPSMH